MKHILVALSFAALASASVYDVRKFGAAGDKKTLDTAAIQKAIDACTKTGGMVYFPTGDYLSGTLHLRSNVTLHLSPGATLWGSRNIADYNPRHLLYGVNVERFAIEGGGTINGQGDAFFDKDYKPLARPSPLIELVGCRDVRIQDVRILRAPGWTLRPKNCDRVAIRGVTLINDMRAVNSDGIDPDSSRNVIISDCYIEAGDDCIVVKTTNRNPPPLPSENITVTNCVLVSSASALKLGTESHADFRHIVMSNCVIRGSRTGIALLNKDGATMEHVSFSNITMQTAPKWGKGVEWPIVVDLEKREPNSRVGRIRDVTFSDIQVLTKGRVMISGMPASPIERLAFRNVFMRVNGWEKIEGERKLRGGTVKGDAANLDYGPVPAAIILGHARDLTFRDVRVQWDAPGDAPERHALWSDHVEGLTLAGFTGRQAARQGKLPVIYLKDSRDVWVTGSRALPGAGTFVRVEGGDPASVVVEGNRGVK
ncbi:MAG: glycoside hydrolase family 28 protein [Bryobacteraceae bacterium]